MSAEELEAAVVAVLRRDRREVTTAAVIAAIPEVEGWRVRHALDGLASADVVGWRRGRNNPTARVWWLNWKRAAQDGTVVTLPENGR